MTTPVSSPRPGFGLTRRIALTVCAIAVLPLAACGGTSQSETPEEPPSREAGVQGDGMKTIKSWTLVFGRQLEDGVKGMIKNFSSAPVHLSQRRTFGVTLQPGEQVEYYLSNGDDSGDDLKSKRAEFDWTREGAAQDAFLSITDPLVGRPSTKYRVGHMENNRDGWNEGTNHHEDLGGYKTWIKRENDDWKGSYETRATVDWAVFTIHIDQVP